LGAGSALGCSQRQHPPPFELSQAGGAATGGGIGELNVGDASTDAALCGDQQIPAISDPPNLYFVVDRSSSMLVIPPGSSVSKYESAYIAIGVMLRAVGHRVRYGAAVFPGLLNQDGCAPGAEIFPTTAGDPPNYALNGQNGPNLSDLLTRLETHLPDGGTPTAASLRALKPTVLRLTGKKTYLVLMTDGAPNCNQALTCDVGACIPNIEHQPAPGGMLCDDTFNCCNAKTGGDCVDADETEAAVAEYEAAGVDTYVVGMPGSEAYRLLLGRLALAGNTARPGATPYYAVSDTSQLSDVLRGIGAQVAISCDLPLATAPDDPNLVNVYFDNQVVANDDRNGWHYSGDSSIQFKGAACTQLSSGDVLRVQVLYGCPTQLR
jgi:hypothetical protein